MLNPLVALLFYLAVGVIVIRFGRSSYARPGITLERWYSYLPRKDWSRRLLRGISVFWVFGGFLIIATGITSLPALRNFRGSLLVVIVPIIAALSTALLLWKTPHRNRARQRKE
jgi:hypothetical protein